MIAGAVASLITGLAHKSSFFYWQLERRGLHLEGGKALYLLKSTDVEAAMSRDFLTVKPAEPLAQVRDILIAQYGGKLLVADETGALVGVITSSEMTSDTFDPNLDTLIRAEDICRRKPGHRMRQRQPGRRAGASRAYRRGACAGDPRQGKPYHRRHAAPQRRLAPL